MSSGRPTTIADAGPTAAPTTATVTGAEQRAYLATRGDHPATEALHRAALALEGHVGAKTGPEYEAKLKAWRARYAEWRLAMKSTAEQEHA